MQNLYFKGTSFEKIKEEILNKKTPSKKIFNFLNTYSVYLFVNHPRFRESILKKENINLLDGSTVSLMLSMKSLSKIKRLKGPNFFRKFLRDIDLNQNKKHLFIGLNKGDLDKVLEKFSILKREKLFYHEIPLIKQKKYDDKDLVKKINILKPNYIWVGIGNPKQEILANDIVDKIKKGFIFNVGAAFDYVIDKKKHTPKFFEKIGLEWFYRMVTDFKHTFPKVIKSFIGQFYLFSIVKLRK